TDIEYDGVVYHVQTEDKGLDTPLILSLVYSGGAILASKRSPYEDLIAEGFDEDVLAQRLKRQHRLICAAINAGRIDDLKRMGAKAAQTQTVEPIASAPEETVKEPAQETAQEAAQEVAQEPEFEPYFPAGEIILTDDTIEERAPAVVKSEPVVVDAPEPEAPQQPPEDDSAYTVHDPRRASPLGEVARVSDVSLTVLNEEEFRAGQAFTIRVLVQKGSGAGEKPLSGIELSVKILGTMFRPQIHSVKTGKNGVAAVSAKIPEFTSGRAAILVRAMAEGKPIEMRRVIHPA
ncbi:MAG TPA: hypothetical protein VGW36_07315, partial [Pyrinomonadaceae bacterium]|nr:hypothetical protein [Pyrinomonadaceae bacterium]